MLTYDVIEVTFTLKITVDQSIFNVSVTSLNSMDVQTVLVMKALYVCMNVCMFVYTDIGMTVRDMY